MRVKRESYGVNRDGWWILEKILLGEGEPKEFNPDSSTLRGRKVKHNSEIELGRIAGGYSGLNSDLAVRIDYVIYSYGTPIAWRWIPTEYSANRWEIPNWRHSAATSKHQNRVRTALNSVM